MVFTRDMDGDGINDSDDDGIASPEQVISNRYPCIHRGSQRRCCDDLYLCRKFPGESCTPGVSNTPELRSCMTCELYEAENN